MTGVKIGASNPTPLPPVFNSAEASPPFRGSSAGAVVQKIPSHNPSDPIASEKHQTTAVGSPTETPRALNTAQNPIPAIAMPRDPQRGPNRRHSRSVTQPPPAMPTAIAI